MSIQEHKFEMIFVLCFSLVFVTFLLAIAGDSPQTVFAGYVGFIVVSIVREITR